MGTNAAEKLLFYICLFHLAILASEAWRPYKIEFTNVTSFSSVDFCQINSSISSVSAISIFVNVRRPIPNLYTKTVITLEKSHGIYDMELINKTLDSCKLFHDPTYEPIVQVFYRELTRTGSFPKRCPIAKKLYFVKDVIINSENLPPTMSFKGCMVDIVMMTKSGNTLEVACGYNIRLKVKQSS